MLPSCSGCQPFMSWLWPHHPKPCMSVFPPGSGFSAYLLACSLILVKSSKAIFPDKVPF